MLRQLASVGESAVGLIVAETDRLARELADKLKKARSVTSAQLHDLLYRSYFSVHPVVRYKRTALDRLSLGQKATVLVKIYLAEGDRPIIIDSHDDHLDNESIMDELVGSIRQARNFRQVILASNNGNVVVNSDADQLIVARHVSGVISYESGSLEDPKIRDTAVRVLEGGIDAFRQRQEKYRIRTS
jgi:ABC-type ATPase with predicted acetyltransferase domain